MSVKKFNIIEQLPVLAAVVGLVLAAVLAGMLGNKAAQGQRRVELAGQVLAVLRERHLQPELSTTECRARVVKANAAKWRVSEERAEGRMERLAKSLLSQEGVAEGAMAKWWLGEKGAEEELLTKVGKELERDVPKQERWKSVCRWITGLLASRAGKDDVAVRELALLESGAAEKLSAGERRLVRLDQVKSLEEAGQHGASREKLLAILEDAGAKAILGEFPMKVWLARLDRKGGNDERAKADLRDLLREAERTHRRDIWQVEALAELGKVLFLQGQHDGLVLMQEAVEMRLAYLRAEDPKVLEDKVWLAGALRAAGDRPEALEMVEDVIEQAQIGSDASDAHYPLALAWVEKGEILRANGDMQGALKAAEQGKGVERRGGYRNVRLQVRSTEVSGVKDSSDEGKKTAE